MWSEGARGGFDQAAAPERVASGRRAPYLPCALLVVSRWCLEGSGKERRRVGDHLDAAPAQAWPGRVMIAKPVQSYSPAVNKKVSRR